MASPSPRSLPTGVQPIFDAIEQYMSDNGYIQLNATEQQDGAGKNQTVLAIDPLGVKVNYTLYSPGVRIVISPPSANLGPGGAMQFAATAQNADGSAVTPVPTFTWAVVPGAIGTIDGNGLYRAPSSIASNAADSCKCSATGTQAYTVFTVSLHP